MAKPIQIKPKSYAACKAAEAAATVANKRYDTLRQQAVRETKEWVKAANAAERKRIGSKRAVYATYTCGWWTPGQVTVGWRVNRAAKNWSASYIYRSKTAANEALKKMSKPVPKEKKFTEALAALMKQYGKCSG